jgi:MinD-like ATPase involved in chromosome partitioning or flagellar assembly
MGSMRTITFYSYKGGVGRTLAAANFAVYLAKLGLKTVVVDFDLEAPGIDAKFPLLKVPAQQKGILDYILDYQLNNEDPGSVKHICLQVPIESSDSTTPLWLIPAGQYLSEEYYRKLSQLDWSFIFSEERDGVAFFQQFLAHIKQELQADVVIIDSRTGITEIAGLCTQQLADEVVMLSSLSSESIRVTKHIKQLIQQSKIAKALEKSIDIKIVVSRVPKPEDLVAFKEQCCELFDVEETQLFFLFSCPALEQEEFLAISTSEIDEELVSNYVRLFYGLNLELADKNIRAEIEQISSKLLLVPPEESEQKILELVALYPHPEVYRTAMHFFSFVKNEHEMTNFAWKLFELLPNDEEVQKILAKRYLALAKRQKFIPIVPLKINSDLFTKNAIRAIEPYWKKDKLNPLEIKQYAEFLADEEQFSKSLEVALPLCNNEQLDAKVQVLLRLVAVRSASKLGQNELAEHMALTTVDMCQESEGSSRALEIASQLLQHYFSKTLLEKAVYIARQLNLVEELEQDLKKSEEIIKLHNQPTMIEEIKDLELYELTNFLYDYDDTSF